MASVKTASQKPTITPVGIAVLWFGIALLAFGGFRFSGVTMLLGLLCLGKLLVARFLCRKNLEGLILRRHMPRTAFAGELFESTVFIRRERLGRFDLDGYEVQFLDRLLNTISSFQRIDFLPSHVETRVKIRTRLPRRGRHGRSRFELKSSWPFGLYSVCMAGEYQSRTTGEADEIVIFPRPLMPALLLRQLEKIQAEALAKNSFEPENAGDFRGVRPYRPGDRVKSIHWSATARADTLLVRDWDPPRPKPQRFGLILHSLSKPGQLVQPERFEIAIRVAAGLVIYCRENRIPLWLSLDVTSSEWLKIPDKTGFTTAFLELALVSPKLLNDAAALKKRVLDFEACERLFVISDSAVKHWRGVVSGQHSAPILADPDSVMTPKSRKVRIAKVKTASSTTQPY